ncbi:MAG: hypothetical protein OQK82_06680 [Candidatus Pacearchaeota archaeon]|nr:hypothetical protein [Candidatus Pacearchaeota archaeon]
MYSNKKVSIHLRFTCLLLLHVTYVDGATANLNYENKFQTIEGFGGGFSFRKYPWFHPKKEELYDSIFNAARINIVRIGNYYYQETTENRQIETPMMLEIQHRWPEVKTILTSWTPPPFLKSNNSVVGGNEHNDTGTISKNGDGLYMYDEYAYYWMKAVQYFSSNGMKIDWVSIQNEPDCAAWYEGCVLEPYETPTAASYGKALDAVFTTFREFLPNPPPLIGPDVVGIYDNQYTRYLNSTDVNRNQLVAYSHHLYNYSGPEWMALPPQQFPDKPIYQTEFLINEGEAGRTWFDHAVFIHNSLVVENVSMYCIFALTYKPASTHCFFSLDTTGSDWYETRPTYYMFKHFSRSIRRGWRRCEITVDDPALLVSAFCNTYNDSTAIVILNTSTSRNTVTVNVPGKKGEYFQTGKTDNYVFKGTVQDKVIIEGEGRSITTIELHNDYSSTRRSLVHKVPRSIQISTITGNLTEGVTVHYSIPRHQPATLSLTDLHGNILATRSHTGLNQMEDLSCHFNQKFAHGNYIFILKSGPEIKSRIFTITD